jgi:hypothetical protein
MPLARMDSSPAGATHTIGVATIQLAHATRHVGTGQCLSPETEILKPTVVVPPVDRTNGVPPCMRAIAATIASPSP